MSDEKISLEVKNVPFAGGLEMGDIQELIGLIKDVYEGFKTFDEWSKQLAGSVFDWEYGVNKSSLFKQFTEEDQMAIAKRSIDEGTANGTGKLIGKFKDQIKILQDNANEMWGADSTEKRNEVLHKLDQTTILLDYATEHLKKAKAAEDAAAQTQKEEKAQLEYEQLQNIYKQRKIDGLSPNDQFQALKGNEGALVQNLVDFVVQDSNRDFSPKTPDEALGLLRSYGDAIDIDKKNSALKRIIEWQDLETRIKSISTSTHTDKSNAAHGQRTPQNNPTPELNNTIQALNRAATQLQGMPDVKTLQQQLNSTLTLVNKAISISEADNTRSQKLEREINALHKKVDMLQGHLKYIR